MKALIDADSLLYKVGFAIEDKTIWNECEVDAGLEDEEDVQFFCDLEVCKKTFDTLIENIMFATETNEALLVFTGSNNFRHKNPLGYKEHRKDIRKPLIYDDLLKYALANYNCKVVDGIEADDYVVYLKTKLPDEYFLCAIDKDVLYQTVGEHYDYNNDRYVTTNEMDAIRYAYYQTLVGDSSDGYKGCKGIGPVKANKILDDVLDSCTPWANNKQLHKAYWEAVVEAYESKGLSEYDALWTMRLANMYQYDGKKVTMWSPP